MEDVSNHLNVLTYNLLYEVSNKSKYTKKLISDLKSTEIFDIGGFQEVTKETKSLLLGEIDILKLGKIIKCQVGITHIMTILNPEIELKAVCWDTFITYYGDSNKRKKKKGGRPFQILVCEYKEEDLLIINCHFPHITKKELEQSIIKKLTQNLTFGVKIDDAFRGGNPIQNGACDIELDKTFKKQNISDLIVGKNFKVIMLGDFNDREKFNLYKGFKPFKTQYNHFLKSISEENKNLLDRIKLGGSGVPKPPKSCCLDYHKKKDKFTGKFSGIGDYILVDESIRIVSNNYIPEMIKKRDIVESTSDHLPVYLKINLKPIDKGKKSPSKSEEKSASKNNNSKKLRYSCKLEKFKIKTFTKKKK